MKRILVVRSGGIGDFILVLPALRALREKWTGAQLEILGRPHIAELARGRGYAESVRSIDDAEFARCFVSGAFQDAAGSSLAQYFSNFDLILSFLPDREGVFEQNLRSLGLQCLSIPSPSSDSLHATEHFLRELQPLGIEVRDYALRVYPSAEDRNRAEQFLTGARLITSRPLVAIHPGSGSSKKNWPVENFAAVARWLQESQRVELCIVAGEADHEPLRILLDALQPNLPSVAQDLPLTTLSGILERCRLLLGNDNGISHLAAAAGTPVIVFFGPSDPRVWQPLGREVRVIRFSEASVEKVKEAIQETIA